MSVPDYLLLASASRWLSFGQLAPTRFTSQGYSARSGPRRRSVTVTARIAPASETPGLVEVVGRPFAPDLPHIPVAWA